MALGPGTLEILLGSEDIAREVDDRDVADADELPEEVAATLYARRQRLLIELDTCGVLDGEAATRAELVAHGLARLVEYHDAATALRRYLASPERAALVDTTPPARLLDARISLDWFRRPGVDRGRPLPPHVFLAHCERMILDLTGTTGSRWAKFLGVTHVLHYRREVADAPRLFRAGDRRDAVALTVDPAPFANRILRRDYASNTPRYASSDHAIEVPAPQVDAWLDALDRVGAILVGGVHGGAEWDTAGDTFELRAGGKVTKGHRMHLDDVIGVVASDSGLVSWRRRGGRVQPLIAMSALEAAYAARDLARWRGCTFGNETGLELPDP